MEEYATRFDDLWCSLAQRRGFREYLAGLLLPRDRNKTHQGSWAPVDEAHTPIDTAGELVRREWELVGSTIEYHRAQIRKTYGTRPADEVRSVEIDRGRLADAVRRRCRSEGVEPPTARVAASAVRRFEEAFAAGVAEWLGVVAYGRPQHQGGTVRFGSVATISASAQPPADGSPRPRRG
ncbi:hypothetical protein ABZ260_44180 [Streptosporangium sp. NPDC006013]|uniref:hypothetical protein n=1 Tax=Streptosporangium sp. NPDC006013 TaxID=3155596 RepID=UPI0033ABFE02